jgi:catechol 2,3-dioxygenase-like lactoylglutathione lyase family enzyme
MPSLSKISVIMVGVSDMDQSVAFYRDKLGLQFNGPAGEFAFFQAGGLMLALSKAHSAALGKEPGNTEIVFGVDHVRETYDDLRSRGVEFKRDPRVATGTMWTANFTDPDGHSLSIFGPE